MGGVRVAPEPVADPLTTAAPSSLASASGTSGLWPGNSRVHPSPPEVATSPQPATQPDLEDAVGDDRGDAGDDGEKEWVPPKDVMQMEACGQLFIPFAVAKAQIAQVQADMVAMKEQQLTLVDEMEQHYKDIERDLQDYFLAYIKKLKTAAEERELAHASTLLAVEEEAGRFQELAEASMLEATTKIAGLERDKQRLQQSLLEDADVHDLLAKERALTATLRLESSSALGALLADFEVQRCTLGELAGEVESDGQDKQALLMKLRANASKLQQTEVALREMEQNLKKAMQKIAAGEVDSKRAAGEAGAAQARVKELESWVSGEAGRTKVAILAELSSLARLTSSYEVTESPGSAGATNTPAPVPVAASVAAAASALDSTNSEVEEAGQDLDIGAPGSSDVGRTMDALEVDGDDAKVSARANSEVECDDDSSANARPGDASSVLRDSTRDATVSADGRDEHQLAEMVEYNSPAEVVGAVKTLAEKMAAAARISKEQSSRFARLRDTVSETARAVAEDVIELSHDVEQLRQGMEEREESMAVELQRRQAELEARLNAPDIKAQQEREFRKKAASETVEKLVHEDGVSVQARAAAQTLQKQNEQLQARRRQMEEAAARLEEERVAALDDDELEAMDEDEREEFMKIRERELKQMERKLEEKQRELDAHVAANEKMQQLLADSARGEHLTAEEAQRMIADHAQEIDELRQESDRRVGKLQAELASAREALDLDAEAMQDRLDTLGEELEAKEERLLAALDESGAFGERLALEQEAAAAREAELMEQLLAAKARAEEVELRHAAAAAAEVESAAAAKEGERAELQEQLVVARAALREAEQQDKDAAKAGGGGKVVRSEEAKAAYWELERLKMEAEGQQKEIEEARQELEALKAREAQLLEESSARMTAEREKAEAQQRDRLAAMEQEFRERRALLEAQQRERAALAERKSEREAAQVAHAADPGDAGELLADIKAEATSVARGRPQADSAASGSLAAPTAPAKSKAKEKAAIAAAAKKEDRTLATQQGGEITKKLRDAERRIRQLEAAKSKLESKVRELEANGPVSKGPRQEPARQGVATGDKKAAAAGQKAIKEVENLKKREEKFKEQLSQVKARLEELEKEHGKLQKENAATVKELDKVTEAAGKGAEAAARAVKAEEDLRAAEARATDLEGMYKKEMSLRKKYYNQIEDMKGKIRVYARCRPFATYEIEKDCNQCVVFKDDTTCTVDVGVRGKKEFEFDEVFRLDSTQQQIFEGVSHLVQSAVDGYNVCIFAYGQTGSGKTFTMYGKRDDESLWGIAPRCMRDLFEIIARDSDVFEFAVSCYMLELYNDGLVDLLVEKRKKGEAEKEKKKLDVKLDKRGVVVVTGAEVRSCESFEELERWNNFGMDQRHVASTAMNAESSRSHLIFSILVEARNKQTGAASIGKLSLVDLAGSERQSKTHAEGDRLKEAKSINMSLSALGDVISKLAAGDKHVPYRNNKLTQLLQDGLGGNAKTLMFVNISPADYNAEETSTSLQYAQRVKLITNVANKQQESAEVQRLKRIIKALKGGEAVEELEEHEEAEGDVEVEIGGNGEADDSAWMEGPQGDLEAREGQ